MPVIETIDALIHPDFYLMCSLNSGDKFISHPEEDKLREAWDGRVREMVGNPSGRLVYITWLNEKKLKLGSDLQNPWELMDFERIKRYEGLLSDRMFVSPMFLEPFAVDRLKVSGNIDENTTLYAMGEWTDQCVKTYGENLRRSVNVRPENFSILGNVSRFSWESKAFTQWHEDLRQKSS